MSAPIQRIVATPLHAVAESNIALAHLNFDFSLAKFEAPPELLPLGKQLSKARRESAEDGSFHILARRLKVLFDDVLPDVPALLEAYGTRASEIAQETAQALEKPNDISGGFFGTHLGIDSTTIWATATSGKSVLRIHLLACMLARIWSPQEATSIWVDLVGQRQRIIKKQAQSAEISDNYMAQAAAAHEIDRSTLGRWDASARAWLQVADQKRKKQQIQAQLIVNNLSIAVKSDNDSEQDFASTTKSYNSVLQNLNRALTTLNKLVKGEPQRITDGGILLGLISWHLYPDLVVLGSQTQEIYQRDSLIKEGGIVTISISHQASHGDGVYWSLPLASLRYYGTVERERSTMHDSRITVARLQALLLGALLGADDDSITIARMLESLWEIYYRDYQAIMCQVTHQPSELQDDLNHLNVVGILPGKQESLRGLMRILHFIFPLKGGIDLLFSADDNEKTMATQLMRYGRNYGRSWIGNAETATFSFFGLTNLSSLLFVAKSPGVRIRLLRELCEEEQLSPSDYVIRFKTSEDVWAYASIANEPSASVQVGMKRKWDEYEGYQIEDIQCLEVPPGENWLFVPAVGASSGYARRAFYEPLENNYERKAADRYHPAVQDEIFRQLVEENPRTGECVLFHLAFGEHDLAAVYTRQTSSSASRKQQFPNTVKLEKIRSLLDMNQLRLDIMAQCVLNHFQVEQPAHGNSLLALGRVMDYYNCHLPEATVSMAVIKKPLNTWKWTRSVIDELDALTSIADQLAHERASPVSIYPSLLPRESAFAAILQFESGTIDVEVSDLTSVLAISSGNSLFIAEEILHDPIPPAGDSPYAISHMIGNIGKPGIALLIPPPELEMRQHNLERWRFINHNKFNGQLTGGMFEGTSLHLSFTGWEGPVSLGSATYRGMEAYFVEAVVSINDGGDWVGDLNILEGLRELEKGVVLSTQRTCSHDPSFAATRAKMVSIDCWEEILDPPEGFLVLRSTPDTHHKAGYWQWMVRLAAVGIASSKKYRCICLPLGQGFCWECLVGRLRTEDKQNVLFIC